MAKRIVTKIGDVFCAEFEDGTKGYFQYIANDRVQMNSSVIRAFKTHYPIDAEVKIDDIVKDEVSFYAHTILKAGIQLDFWHKVGKSKDIGGEEINGVVFGYILGDVYDLEDINKYEDIFKSWVIWRITDNRWTKVGALPKEYCSTLELGGIWNALSIKDKMRTGYYISTSREFSIIKRIPRPEYNSYLRKETVDEIRYYHFKGEILVDYFIIAKGETLSLKQHLCNSDVKFWDINWKYMNFITDHEFISVKRQYVDTCN